MANPSHYSKVTFTKQKASQLLNASTHMGVVNANSLTLSIRITLPILSNPHFTAISGFKKIVLLCGLDMGLFAQERKCLRETFYAFISRHKCVSEITKIF